MIAIKFYDLRKDRERRIVKHQATVWVVNLFIVFSWPEWADNHVRRITEAIADVIANRIINVLRCVTVIRRFFWLKLLDESVVNIPEFQLLHACNFPPSALKSPSIFSIFSRSVSVGSPITSAICDSAASNRRWRLSSRTVSISDFSMIHPRFPATNWITVCFFRSHCIELASADTCPATMHRCFVRVTAV